MCGQGHIEVEVPKELLSDTVLAIEPRFDNDKPKKAWVRPQIAESVGGKLRIVNDTSDPQAVGKHEHFCQARKTSAISDSDESGCESFTQNNTTRVLQTSVIHSDQVSVDPDKVLPAGSRVEFRNLLQDFDQVFSPNFKGYNGAVGPFQVLLLLTFCLLLLPLWESVIVLCFVVRYFMSILVLQSS